LNRPEINAPLEDNPLQNNIIQSECKLKISQIQQKPLQPLIQHVTSQVDEDSIHSPNMFTPKQDNINTNIDPHELRVKMSEYPILIENKNLSPKNVSQKITVQRPATSPSKLTKEAQKKVVKVISSKHIYKAIGRTSSEPHFSVDISFDQLSD
jgi:hypothetical protein